MDSLIEKTKEYVMEESRKYKETSEDHYDFWNEHIRYVVLCISYSNFSKSRKM